MLFMRLKVRVYSSGKTKLDVLQLKQLGHSVDKVEYIVMGGTFMALDDDYKDFFIRNLHDALSGHTSSCVQEAVRLAISVRLCACLAVCCMHV